MCTISTECSRVGYADVRKAMVGQPYPMSLTGVDEIRAVTEAVNQGIDSHLEACYCRSRGDTYGEGERKAGRRVICRTLECRVSIESLPVLIRRLFEGDEAAVSLGRDILASLGFDEFDNPTGREAAGLE